MTEKSESRGIAPDCSLPLEEYKETIAYLRHDDQQAWTILKLSGTVALALWAYTFKTHLSGQRRP